MQKPPKPLPSKDLGGFLYGGQGRDRTGDTWIFRLKHRLQNGAGSLRNDAQTSEIQGFSAAGCVSTMEGA